jgi:hypothetical protein
MADSDRLLGSFIESYLAGERPDAASYLDQLEGAERDLLGELIEAFLLDAPSQAWDSAAYRESIAKQVVESLDRSLHGQAGLWPAVLPRLRDRAKLRRAELVERLAVSLGVGDQREKVGDYYHQMEQGLLAPPGVSDRVLAALGEIVGESAARLREAGNALLPEGQITQGDADAAFARLGTPDPEQIGRRLEPPGAGPPDDCLAASERPDEVDRLFRGG